MKRIIRSSITGLLLIVAGLAHAETVVVEMKKYKFVPEEVTIKVGDTVRWVNAERRQYHTVWFKELGEKGTAELYPDESYEKTFDTPGNFPYLCEPHHDTHGMIGIVHVTE